MKPLELQTIDDYLHSAAADDTREEFTKLTEDLSSVEVMYALCDTFLMGLTDVEPDPKREHVIGMALLRALDLATLTGFIAGFQHAREGSGIDAGAGQSKQGESHADA